MKVLANQYKKPPIYTPCDERQEALLAEVQSWPRRIGKPEYIAYIRGQYLSPKRRILATCYHCNNGYVDGAFDCQNYDCPLHKLMPYKGKHPRFDEETAAGRNDGGVGV